MRHALVEQRALERGLVAAEERVEQDLRCRRARAVGCAAQDVAAGRARVLGRGVHGAADVGGAGHRLGVQGCELRVGGNAHRHHIVGRSATALAELRRRYEHVARDAAFRCRDGAGPQRLEASGCPLLVELALLGGDGHEVAFVQELERMVDVQVAVEDDVAVVGAVVAPMLVEVGLVGERRDGLRRAARLERVARAGEQCRLHLVVQDRVRVRERALHLVEHHAVVDQGGLVRAERSRVALAVVGDELVVPPLLFEDGLLRVDLRVEHGVEVHVHQVEQVALVRRRHRVERLVGERHGVQERLHRPLQQVDERLLHREAPRSAQNGVLQDVEDARVVLRGRAEPDGKGLVVVVVGQVEQPRARFLVAPDIGGAFDFGEVFALVDGEAVEGGSGNEFHVLPFIV